MFEIPALLSVAADSNWFRPIHLAKMWIGPTPPIHPSSEIPISLPQAPVQTQQGQFKTEQRQCNKKAGPILFWRISNTVIQRSKTATKYYQLTTEIFRARTVLSWSYHKFFHRPSSRNRSFRKCFKTENMIIQSVNIPYVIYIKNRDWDYL